MPSTATGVPVPVRLGGVVGILRSRIGSGIPFDNDFATPRVGPDGTVCVPVRSGIVRLAPAQHS